MRAGFLGARVWVKHPTAKLHPPTGKPHSSTRVTREVNSGAGTRIPTSSELRASHHHPPTRTHTTRGGPLLRAGDLEDPHAQQYSHGGKRVPAGTGERTSGHLLSGTPGLVHQPSFSFRPVPLKALTCSTLSVQQLTDSWESLAQEQPPKCWGDELRALVTPKSKTLSRDGKAP